MSPQHRNGRTLVEKGTPHASNSAYPLDHNWFSLRLADPLGATVRHPQTGLRENPVLTRWSLHRIPNHERFFSFGRPVFGQRVAFFDAVRNDHAIPL